MQLNKRESRTITLVRSSQSLRGHAIKSNKRIKQSNQIQKCPHKDLFNNQSNSRQNQGKQIAERKRDCELITKEGLNKIIKSG